MSQNRPLVSVVIPCYNATRYIADALNSLRNQTFRDFETLLINDGCPDTANLERVLEPYMSEIAYLKSGEWASISGSRNKGILRSRARYIALLDADDVWEPEYLAVMTGILEADPSLALVYPNATYFGESPWAGRTFMAMNPISGPVTMEKLISRECTVFISVTARRESLIQAGLFDPDVRGGEDWDLWMRLARTGAKLTYTNQPLARYRLRRGSMSADKIDLLQNGLNVCRKHLALPEITDQERGWLETTKARYQAQIDQVLAKQALYSNRCDEARRLFQSANRVLREPKISLGILGLSIAPELVHRYIRRRYPTEFDYIH